MEPALCAGPDGKGAQVEHLLSQALSRTSCWYPSLLQRWNLYDRNGSALESPCIRQQQRLLLSEHSLLVAPLNLQLDIASGSAAMLQLCIAVHTCSVESLLNTDTCQGPRDSAKGWPSTTLLQCDAAILVQSRPVMGYHHNSWC